MATGKPYLRKLKSGKVVLVKGRTVKAKQATGKGNQLKAGLKFNAAGQVVKDTNTKRVANRTRKQAGKKGAATNSKKPTVKKSGGKKKKR